MSLGKGQRSNEILLMKQVPPCKVGLPSDGNKRCYKENSFLNYEMKDKGSNSNNVKRSKMEDIVRYLSNMRRLKNVL